MSSASALWSHLGISPIGVLSVVLSTAALYVVIALVLRAWGQRLRASSSTLSLALVTLLGAIAARATLGDYPTLSGGLVAIVTLLGLEQLFGRWSAVLPRRRLRPVAAPTVLWADGELQRAALRRHRMSEGQLWSELRLRGVSDLADVGTVVLEPRGRLSLLPPGARLQGPLADGVRGLPPQDPQH